LTLKPKRQRKCKICGEPYKPFNSLQKVCSPHCALTLTAEDNARAERKQKAFMKKQAKAERKLLRQKKEDLKTIGQLLGDAQKEFNKFIRTRDAGKPCISCGNTNPVKYDCGHYRTVGSCRELRFHPFNAHRQCSANCNVNLSGNIIQYRIGLVMKIGAENVEWLENHHDYYQFTREDAKEIKQHYRSEWRRLEKEARV
jgi:hypothetical protein